MANERRGMRRERRRRRRKGRRGRGRDLVVCCRLLSCQITGSEDVAVGRNMPRGGGDGGRLAGFARRVEEVELSRSLQVFIGIVQALVG